MEDYEKEIEQIREKNEEYLDLFEKTLKASGISQKTINRHLENIDFYINEYLNYDMPSEMKDGVYCVSSFLGSWYIRKCLDSTPTSIKNYTASLKKFYKCMMELGYVEKEGYEDMCETIKDELDDWMSMCAEYNDPYGEDPFVREMRELLGPDIF